MAWACWEIEPGETNGSIRARPERSRHGIRQKALVGVRKRKPAVKAAEEIAKCIVTGTE